MTPLLDDRFQFNIKPPADTPPELVRRLATLSSDIAAFVPEMHGEFHDWRMQSHTPAEIEQTIAYWQRQCDRERAAQSRREHD